MGMKRDIQKACERVLMPDTRILAVCLLGSTNLVYAYEALLGGIMLIERDSNRAALKRAILLGMYLQFNLDRREVIDAYRV